MQKGHRSQTYNNQRHQNNRPKTTKIKNQRQPTQHQRWLTPTYNSHPSSVIRHLSSVTPHPSPLLLPPSLYTSDKQLPKAAGLQQGIAPSREVVLHWWQ